MCLDCIFGKNSTDKDVPNSKSGTGKNNDKFTIKSEITEKRASIFADDSSSSKSDSDKKISPQLVPAQAETDSSKSKMKKDLVVDDSDPNRVVIRKYLTRFGRVCDEASNGQAAIDVIAKNGEYSIIWMDVQMPVMNGIKSTEQLRKSGYKGYIIGITGHVDGDSVHDCKHAGMNDILAKPIDRRVLEAYIEKYGG